MFQHSQEPTKFNSNSFGGVLTNGKYYFYLLNENRFFKHDTVSIEFSPNRCLGMHVLLCDVLSVRLIISLYPKYCYII